MSKDNRKSVVIYIVESLRRAGSWTCRTHIQKSTYLLRDLCGVDLGYAFTLYKHGPYSFELDADIEELRIMGALDYEVGRSDYGPRPRYKVGDAPSADKREIDPSLSDDIDSITSFFGKRDVRDLECVSTLVWCDKTSAGKPRGSNDLKSCVQKLKPHLSDAQIEENLSLLNQFKDGMQTGRKPARAT